MSSFSCSSSSHKTKHAHSTLPQLRPTTIVLSWYSSSTNNNTRTNIRSGYCGFLGFITLDLGDCIRAYEALSTFAFPWRRNLGYLDRCVESIHDAVSQDLAWFGLAGMEFCAIGMIYLFTALLDLVKKWQAVSHTHAMDKMAVVAVWMMNAMVKYGDFWNLLRPFPLLGSFLHWALPYFCCSLVLWSIIQITVVKLGSIWCTVWLYWAGTCGWSVCIGRFLRSS